MLLMLVLFEPPSEKGVFWIGADSKGSNQSALSRSQTGAFVVC